MIYVEPRDLFKELISTGRKCSVCSEILVIGDCFYVFLLIGDANPSPALHVICACPFAQIPDLFLLHQHIVLYIVLHANLSIKENFLAVLHPIMCFYVCIWDDLNFRSIRQKWKRNKLRKTKATHAHTFTSCNCCSAFVSSSSLICPHFELAFVPYSNMCLICLSFIVIFQNHLDYVLDLTSHVR